MHGMLRTVGSLKGLHLEAKDGRIGTIKDVYFDDADWTVRFLEVSTGGWLSGREVLITPHSLGRPDFVDGVIPADLTLDQIRNAPGAETNLPVSRQYETEYYNYYGYPYYWEGPYIWGAAGFPFYSTPAAAAFPPDGAVGAGDSTRQRMREGQAPQGGNPHLRSSSEVDGYQVEAVDGGIGHLDDFLLDEQDWSIRYLILDTRNWLPGIHVVIPVDWTKNIRWGEGVISVGHFKEEIRNAPEFIGKEHLTREYVEALDLHYGQAVRHS